MILETLNTYLDFITEIDLKDIVEIYNSNEDFLIAHMDKNKVDIKWLKSEILEMKKVGFDSYKIVDKETSIIIGFLDFSMNEECYLSLLMLHNHYKVKGYGTEVYKGLETYFKKNGAHFIRIDVVLGYSYDVLDFWLYRGFEIKESIKLNWAGKELPALKLIKHVL